MRNWLTWLWRLRSPKFCHLQAGDPRKPVVYFQSNFRSPRTRELTLKSSPRLKTRESGEPTVQVLVWAWRPEKQEPQCSGSSPRAGDPGPSSAVRQRNRIKLPPLLLYSSPQWIRRGPSHRGGPSALLSSLIQMLASPRNTPPDTTRNSVLPAIWTFRDPAKWTGNGGLDIQVLCSFHRHPLEMFPEHNLPGRSLGWKDTCNRVPAEPGPRSEPRPHKDPRQTSQQTAESAQRIRRRVTFLMFKPRIPGQFGAGRENWTTSLPLGPRSKKANWD